MAALMDAALNRYQSLLIGRAEEKEVGIYGIAQQPGCNRSRVDKMAAAVPGLAGDGLLHFAGRKNRIRVAGKFGGRRKVAVNHRMGMPRFSFAERIVGGRHHQVRAEQQVGFPCRNAHGVDTGLAVGNAHMPGDGAEFLRQPGLIEHRHAFLFDVGCHAENRADRERAGAADAGNEDVERAIDVDACWLREFLPVLGAGCRLLFAQLRPPCTETKLGQNPRTQE